MTPSESTAQKRIILTGAPGTGKTTLIKLLRQKGIACIDEPAREIIAEQRAIDGHGLWQRNTSIFVELLLSRSIKNYSLASADLTVYDRGIPDCIAYAHLAGLSFPHGIAASMRYRYDEVVLFAPWEEIYCTDNERTMTFGAVCQFHGVLVQVYENAGYRVREIGQGSTEQRIGWILRD